MHWIEMYLGDSAIHVLTTGDHRKKISQTFNQRLIIP